jgi:hypothetical protein
VLGGVDADEFFAMEISTVLATNAAWSWRRAKGRPPR